MRPLRPLTGALVALAITAPAAAAHDLPDIVEPVRVEHRTLIVEGGQTATLRERWGRLEIDVDGERFEIERSRFRRVRASGLETLAFEGSAADERFAASAVGARVRLARERHREPIELDDVAKLRIAARGGEDRVTVDDLSATATFQVDADLGAGLGSPGDGSDDVDGGASREHVRVRPGDDQARSRLIPGGRATAM